MDSAFRQQLDEYREFLENIVQYESLESLIEDASKLMKKRPHVVCLCFWMAGENLQPDGPRTLSLYRVIANRTLEPEKWHHKEGAFTSVPFDEPIIGQVAATRQARSCKNAAEWDPPEWAVAEGIVSYSAQPLIHRGELIGVWATFMNRVFQQEQMEQGAFFHKMAADYVAASIVNSRNYGEIARLKEKLELENEYLQEEVKQSRGFEDIVGDSPSLKRVLQQIELVAQTDATVLIHGETGTGKELIAQAIHEHSERRRRPLIKVNCASIPTELFESEFFGHVKGAFTGAVKNRIGRFQLADEGTLFLDEVSEIPLRLQGKLLRVLQEGTFEPVGSEVTHRVDVRIIAATNRDLWEEVQKNRFRQDLYYRLSVFPLDIPPLRERAEDIPALSRHFVKKISRRMGIIAPTLNRDQIDRLRENSWIGNVRELENVIERALILSRGEGLDFETLLGRKSSSPVINFPEKGASGTRGERSPKRPYTEQEWKELERENIVLAMVQAKWRVQGPGGAAELLNIKPTTLYARLRALEIKKPKHPFQGGDS